MTPVIRETIAKVLEDLRRDSGAERAVWHGVGAPARAPQTTRAWETELPATAPGAPGELGPRACRRRPLLRAAGIERVAYLRLERDGLLALAGAADLGVGEERLASAARVLCGLDEGGRVRAERERGDRLTGLGLGAAGTAHDLRNLLATALLEFQVAGDAQDRSRLEWTLEQAATLARDFLGGEVDRVRERVELAPLLSREVRRAEAELGAPCELDGASAAELCVAGRADLCGRALRNLLANAAQASPRGHGLALRVREAGAHVELELRDRGRGMDGERLRRSLEPGTSGGGGTGFGTASVLVCLARMGGELALDSRPGEGTTARVRLLRFPGPGAVLVADDDDRARRARCAAIEDAGGRAVGAVDAREARAWLEGGGALSLLVARGLPGRRELEGLARGNGLAVRTARATRR